MSPGPSPSLAEHPRFPSVLAAALARNGLDAYLADPVRKLVTGSADPRSFQCCGSGCSPCVKDYLRAAEMVLQSLGPALEDRQRRRRWWLLWLR